MEVQGGCIQAAYADENIDVDFMILDHDDLEEEDEANAVVIEAEYNGAVLIPDIFNATVNRELLPHQIY